MPRPAAFYAHLLDLERRAFDALPAPMQSVLRAYEDCKDGITIEPALPSESGHAALNGSTGFVAWRGGDGPGVGIRASAMLSQIPCAYDDTTHDHEVFPAGRSDADLQQVDLRATNSWRLS